VEAYRARSTLLHITPVKQMRAHLLSEPERTDKLQ